MRSDRQAFTLTEIAVVLGVIGLIIGGIWVAAASVHEQAKVNRASQLVLTTMTNIKDFMDRTGGKGFGFPADPGVGNGATAIDITSAAVQAGIFSADHDLLTTDPLYPIATPWGSGWTSHLGITTMTYNTGSSGIYRTFILRLYGGVPPDACIKVIMEYLPQWLSLGLFSLGAGTGSAGAWGITPQNYTTINGGVTMPNVASWCSAINPVTNQANSFQSVALEFVYPARPY